MADGTDMKGWPEGKIPARRWFAIEWMAASELSEQCKIILRVFLDLQSDALEPPEVTGMSTEDYCRGVWTRIQIALGAYSAITHALWPTPNSKREKFAKEVTRARGEVLRHRVGVDAKEPVFSRDARNAFEHMDERLDDWVLAQDWKDDVPPGVPTAWSVNPGPPELEPPGYASRGIRYVNLVSMDVRVLDAHANLRQLNDFAEMLLSKIPPQLQVHWGRADSGDNGPSALPPRSGPAQQGGQGQTSGSKGSSETNKE